MADWHEPFRASYRFVRVSRATGYETGEIYGITGGTIKINQDTDTFESADLDLVEPLDLGQDLIRAYLDATFEDGTEETVCLGTWLAMVSGKSMDAALDRMTAYCDGRLLELQQDAFEAPVVVPAGENPVEYAAGIARGIGLEVVMTPSTAVLGVPWVFGLDDAGDTAGGMKLDAVASLLSIAGYAGASTTPMGAVVMQPYVEPSGRSPVWTFEEGPSATFLDKGDDDHDSRDVGNVVLAIYETDEGTVVGTAVDDDPLSPYSTAPTGIGRRNVKKYRYNDTATQAEADAKAAELLATNQSTIHRVTLEHIHCPARVGDVVRVEWPSKGISGTFVVRTQTIEIGSPGCLTTSELRAFERRRANDR